MTNLAIWDKLGRTDPKHTKPFQRAGGFKGTAIKPIYLDQKMTETFGPCGTGWGYSVPQFQLVNGPEGEVAVFCWLTVWYRTEDGVLSEPIPGVGGDFVVRKNKYGTSTDDEAFKKAATDAMGNALKHLGMSADVHMGQFDGSKYAQPEERGSSYGNGGKRVSSAQRGRDGEWDRLEADLLDCKSAADVAKLEKQYQGREYRQWSEAWRYKAEERFAQRMAEFSAPALLAETLRESVESTATPHEPETKAAYVQQSHDAIENMRGNGDALRTWWKNETHARTRFRLSQAEIEDLKQRCAEATRAERNLTFAG